MSEVARLSRTPAGVRLGPLDQIAERGARNFVLQIGEARFHGFVVRLEDAVYGYVDRCPHMQLPLAQELDQYLTPDGGLIACSWHGALFQPQTGACLGGPCAGAALQPWPVSVRDGHIVTN